MIVSPWRSGKGAGVCMVSMKTRAPEAIDSHSRKSPSQSAGLPVTMILELYMRSKYTELKVVLVALFNYNKHMHNQPQCSQINALELL